MAGVSPGITVENVGDITPGTIFIGFSTLPSHSQPKRRPFLALWKVGNQIVSFLQNEGGSVPEAAEKFRRSIASYYPISPARNSRYLPVTATDNFQGFIDLLTPVSLGQSSLKGRSRATRISQGDLRNVIMAHVGLVQCGQEAVNTGQGEQESEMLLIDRNTHDSIRQMALDMLQRSKEGLLHAKRTQEVTKSLVEAFDKPPAAKLILPRLRNSTPSLSSTFVDQSPPPPPQADAQHIHPAQQSSGQQQPHQPQQPLNSTSGQAGCRPDAPPGGRRNPDNGDGGDGSFGTHFPELQPAGLDQAETEGYSTKRTINKRSIGKRRTSKWSASRRSTRERSTNKRGINKRSIGITEIAITRRKRLMNGPKATGPGWKVSYPRTEGRKNDPVETPALSRNGAWPTGTCLRT
ncbi:hypothetical protein C7212DRAFT_344200 [Tuber magnatum]|uniref:Uncharacterized protein n=1 Tax=Tuber magnatum TaxID=42249 RepID=A0A317SUD5_9PEZI|nr:hypothetical protein C7212DRAFT_344200 [Tuber magnatum]